MKCKNKLPSSPEYHFFDLKEFARIFRKSSGEITNATDYWLYLLMGSKEMDGMPDWAEGDKAYEAYFEASAVSNFTPQETIKYDMDMMTEADMPEYAPVTHRTMSDGITLAPERSRHAERQRIRNCSRR